MAEPEDERPSVIVQLASIFLIAVMLLATLDGGRSRNYDDYLPVPSILVP